MRHGRELVFGDFVLQTIFRRRRALERLQMGIQIPACRPSLFRGQDTGSAATLRNLKPERFWAYAEEQSKSEPTLTMAEKEVRHGN